MKSTSKHPKLERNQKKETPMMLFFEVISFETRKKIIGFPLTRRSNVRMKRHRKISTIQQYR